MSMPRFVVFLDDLTVTAVWGSLKTDEPLAIENPQIAMSSQILLSKENEESKNSTSSVILDVRHDPIDVFMNLSERNRSRLQPVGLHEALTAKSDLIFQRYLCALLSAFLRRSGIVPTTYQLAIIVPYRSNAEKERVEIAAKAVAETLEFAQCFVLDAHRLGGMDPRIINAESYGAVVSIWRSGFACLYCRGREARSVSGYANWFDVPTIRPLTDNPPINEQDRPWFDQSKRFLSSLLDLRLAIARSISTPVLTDPLIEKTDEGVSYCLVYPEMQADNAIKSITKTGLTELSVWIDKNIQFEGGSFSEAVCGPGNIFHVSDYLIIGSMGLSDVICEVWRGTSKESAPVAQDTGLIRLLRGPGPAPNAINSKPLSSVLTAGMTCELPGKQAAIEIAEALKKITIKVDGAEPISFHDSGAVLLGKQSRHQFEIINQADGVHDIFKIASFEWETEEERELQERAFDAQLEYQCSPDGELILRARLQGRTCPISVLTPTRDNYPKLSRQDDGSYLLLLDMNHDQSSTNKKQLRQLATNGFHIFGTSC